MSRCLTTILLLATSLLLASCGGGGTLAEGGIGGSGISMGRVTQLGSVFVNGTAYDTDSVPARFIINGDDTRSQSDIAVGMVVTVTGSRNMASASGIAESVTYNSLLVGAIDALDPLDTSSIEVMGQTVLVNTDTVYENPVDTRPLEGLTTSDIVEVSGFTDSVSGEVLATRIVVTDGSGLFRLTGVTSGYSSVSNTLHIGGMAVDLGALDPALVPADGSYVHITGNTAPISGTFLADSLTLVDNGIAASDGTEAELEGIIASGLDGSDRFILNGQTVDASGTPYSGDTASLTAGRVVSVSGILDSGILLADEIELKASSSEREEIAALIQDGAIDVGAGQVILMGQTIQVDNSTIYENDLSGESTFSLSDLTPGQYLEAKVYDNLVVLRASKLELDEQPSGHNAELEGYATGIGADQIEILGVIVDTSSISGYSLDPVQRIEVEGNYDVVSGILTATRIEDDD